MKKIFFAACCSVLMITLMGFIQQPQQQGQKINIQIPQTGFPVSVQTLSPQAFPPAFFLFIANNYNYP